MTPIRPKLLSKSKTEQACAALEINGSASSATDEAPIRPKFYAEGIIADAVKAFLDVWNKVQELRDTRNKLIARGLSGAAVGRAVRYSDLLRKLRTDW